MIKIDIALVMFNTTIFLDSQNTYNYLGQSNNID
jgi:hypothetical protein